MSFKESSIREVKAMAEFDYNALAELFPSRGRMRQRHSFGYKRFAKAAQAIRFAMEDMPRACLVGAFLEVNGRRYGSDDISRLYKKHGLSSNAAQCNMTERRSTSISIGE